MNSADFQQILYNVDYIAKNTCNLDQILGGLLSLGTLSLTEHEIIQNEHPTYRQYIQLCYILVRKGPNSFTNFLSTLVETGNEHVAEEISKPVILPMPSQLTTADTSAHIVRNFKWNVQRPSTYFTGREMELRALHFQFLFLQNTQSVAANTRRVQHIWLSGPGGVGKGELMRQYIQYWFDTDIFHGNCIWLNATNYQTMKESFQNLFEQEKQHLQLRSDNQGRSLPDVVNCIYQRLSTSAILLVLDNYTKSGWNNSSIHEFLPAAHQSDGKYFIFTSRESVSPFESNTESILTLGSLSKEESINFLRQNLASQKEEDLERLATKLDFHPLSIVKITAVINQKFRSSATGRASITDFMSVYERKCTQIISLVVDEENVAATEYQRIPWHLTTLLSYEVITAENVDGFVRDGIGSITDIFGPLHSKSVQIQNLCVLLLEKFGKTDTALCIVQPLYNTTERVHGTQHEVTKKVQEQLADLQFKNNEFTQSLDNYQQIHHWQVEKFGPEDRRTLKSQNCIAKIYLKRERWSEAYDLFDEVDAVRQRCFGIRDRERLKDRYDYGLTLKNNSKLDKALVVLNPIFTTQMEMGDSLAALETKAYIFSILFDLNRTDEVTRCLQELQQLAETVSATQPNHPWIAKIRHISRIWNNPILRNLYLLSSGVDKNCSVM